MILKQINVSEKEAIYINFSGDGQEWRTTVSTVSFLFPFMEMIPPYQSTACRQHKFCNLPGLPISVLLVESPHNHKNADKKLLHTSLYSYTHIDHVTSTHAQ